VFFVHQNVVDDVAVASVLRLGSRAPKASVDVAELNLHVPLTLAETLRVLVAAIADPAAAKRAITITTTTIFFILPPFLSRACVLIP
jgi:hypothetical protein